MIILLNSNIDVERLNCGFSDNYIYFQSDSLIVPLNASITIDNVPIILYPNPQGIFYFNFKEYVSYALNRIVENDNYVNKVIYYTTPIQINFINNTSETQTFPYRFYDGIITFDSVDGLEFLAPKKIKYSASASNDFQKLAIISNSSGAGEIKFYKKETPLIFYSLAYLIGDLGIIIALNESGIITTSGVYVAKRGAVTTEIEIEVDDCLVPKFDIRFKNSKGGFSFWSFDYWQVQRQPKDLGEVSTNTNVMVQIGKSSKDIVIAENDVNYQELFNDLLESNTIIGLLEGYTVEIALTAQSKTIKDFKNNKPFTLQFELPARYTRTL